jgi:hypothetical protein
MKEPVEQRAKQEPCNGRGGNRETDVRVLHAAMEV